MGGGEEGGGMTCEGRVCGRRLKCEVVRRMRWYKVVFSIVWDMGGV